MEHKPTPDECSVSVRDVEIAQPSVRKRDLVYKGSLALLAVLIAGALTLSIFSVVQLVRSRIQ